MDDVWGNPGPEVEFLILAEHAEAIHGKLYLMGGAWETIHVARFDQPVTLSLAAGIQVPWHATNIHHGVVVSVQTADGEVLAAEQHPIMMGRPAHIEPGTSQRALLVLQMSVVLPRPDRYVVMAAIDETPQARVAFRAVPGHAHG